MALTKPQVVTEEATKPAAAESQQGAQADAPVLTGEHLTSEGVAAVTEQVANPSSAVAVAEPTSRAVSVSVSEQRSNAMTQFTQEQAAAGFEGMDLTSFSFDRIKLHEGTFKLGQEDEDLGTSLQVVIMGTRRLYVVRQSDDNDAESYYSYDPKGQTMTDGSSAEAKLAEWLDEGYGTAEAPLDIREYLEAMATLVNRDDERDQEMVMLSIPPASKARLSGVAFQAKSRLGLDLGGVVIECQVGKQAGEGTKKFRPWVFKVVGPYEG